MAFIRTTFKLPENFSKIEIAPSGGLFEEGIPKHFQLETPTFVLALAAAQYQIKLTRLDLYSLTRLLSTSGNVLYCTMRCVMLMDKGPNAETYQATKTATTKTWSKWLTLRHQPIHTSPILHTMSIAPFKIIKHSWVPPRKTFHFNERPPTMQYG